MVLAKISNFSSYIKKTLAMISVSYLIILEFQINGSKLLIIKKQA